MASNQESQMRGGVFDTNQEKSGVSRVTEETAPRLPNATYPFYNDPGYYVVSLDVFHHLHCLVCFKNVPCIAVEASA